MYQRGQQRQKKNQAPHNICQTQRAMRVSNDAGAVARKKAKQGG